MQQMKLLDLINSYPAGTRFGLVSSINNRVCHSTYTVVTASLDGKLRRGYRREEDPHYSIFPQIEGSICCLIDENNKPIETLEPGNVVVVTGKYAKLWGRSVYVVKDYPDHNASFDCNTQVQFLFGRPNDNVSLLAFPESDLQVIATDVKHLVEQCREDLV